MVDPQHIRNLSMIAHIDHGKSTLADQLAQTDMGPLTEAEVDAEIQAVRNYQAVILDGPDDDAVLACALAAQAEVIVSGDRDLLSLKNYQGIDILTAPKLLARIPGE